MNQYVTGTIIKRLREERGMTQLQLAQMLNVSDKAVSKWETGRGYPDITLLGPLAAALGLSVTELLAGENVSNTNRGFNMTRLIFYVCPICGNVLTSTGDAVISCCGVPLQPMEAEEPDSAHRMQVEKCEDEYYVTIDHEMTKEHYLSFIAGIRDDGYEMKKLYPEGAAEASFKIGRLRWLICCCNHHGLFRMRAK